MGKFQHILKSLRTSHGLTQDELAKSLKVSRSTIGMYEKGAREPDFETLEYIADFFNVDLSYLLGRTLKTTVLPESKTLYSSDELQLVDNYRQLSDIGKKKVSTYTINMVNLESAEFELQAAHERTDIDVTDEMRKHDDDIMDDDSEWE